MGEEERALTRGITLDRYDMMEKMTAMIEIVGDSPLRWHQIGFRGDDDGTLQTLYKVVLCACSRRRILMVEGEFDGGSKDLLLCEKHLAGSLAQAAARQESSVFELLLYRS